MAFEAPPAMTFRRTRLAEAPRDCLRLRTPKDPRCRWSTSPGKHEPEGSRSQKLRHRENAAGSQIESPKAVALWTAAPEGAESLDLWTEGPFDHLDPLSPRAETQSLRRFQASRPKPKKARQQPSKTNAFAYDLIINFGAATNKKKFASP